MTRKDYQLIADAIREAREHAEPGNTDTLYGIGMVQAEIASALMRDNPRFDGQRFAEACKARSY